MDGIPYAEKTWTSYENFTAECPWCGQPSIFNRVSDLRDVEPIDFRTVACLNPGCGKQFHINGDTVNPGHEMLLLDCDELLERKHYMNCILTVAQAYEMFFSLFLRAELLFQPWATDPDRDIDVLNRLAGELRKQINDYTFARMRALFLRQLLHGPTPATLGEAETVIGALDPQMPSDADIDARADKRLTGFLHGIKGTRIHEFRNQVVHKNAYRPTRDEAKAALAEARGVLFPLTHYLDLSDDINWYQRRRRP